MNIRIKRNYSSLNGTIQRVLITVRSHISNFYLIKSSNVGSNAVPVSSLETILYLAKDAPKFTRDLTYFPGCCWIEDLDCEVVYPTNHSAKQLLRKR